MKISYHKKFQKNYVKRVKNNRNLDRIFKEKVAFFIRNPDNPCLKNHPLVGKLKNLRSFSITGDLRVVYRPISKDKVLFLDIGSHSQVY